MARSQTKEDMVTEASEMLKELFATPEGQAMTTVEKWAHAKCAEICIKFTHRYNRLRTDRSRMMLILEHEIEQDRLRRFVARRIGGEVNALPTVASINATPALLRPVETGGFRAGGIL